MLYTSIDILRQLCTQTIADPSAWVTLAAVLGDVRIERQPVAGSTNNSVLRRSERTSDTPVICGLGVFGDARLSPLCVTPCKGRSPATVVSSIAVLNVPEVPELDPEAETNTELEV